MRQSGSERVCVDRNALAMVRADGLGWGHDLDCGCFHVEKVAVSRSLWARLRSKLGKGS